MFAVAVALLAVLLIGAVGTPVRRPPARFQLVGFTSASFDGNEGVLGFTAACQAEFRASRMCSSQEVLESVSLPDLAGSAWVRPHIVGGGPGGNVDASGIQGLSQTLTCESWTSNRPFASGGYQGLSINAAGGFVAESCDEFLAVACCAVVY
jgi:hypothetical protein